MSFLDRLLGDANRVARTGDTMSGDLDMAGHAVKHEQVGLGLELTTPGLPQVTGEVRNGPFDVIVRSATFAGSAIQAAIDSLPSTGGTVWIPRGTWILTSILKVWGKSGVVLRGAGIDVTILDGTGIADKTANPSLQSIVAPVSFSSNNAGTTVDGCQIHDLTIKDTDAGSPGGYKLLSFENCTNFEQTRVKLVGGAHEQAVYGATPGHFVDGMLVTKCEFTAHLATDYALAACNVFTKAARNVKIVDNRFDTVLCGVLLDGLGLLVQGNTFHRCRDKAVSLGESGDTAQRSLAATLIDSNVITELGYNHTDNATETMGIDLQTSSITYDDATTDHGTTISNNKCLDGIVTVAQSLVFLYIRGRCSCEHNTMGPLKTSADAPFKVFSVVRVTNHGPRVDVNFHSNRVYRTDARDGANNRNVSYGVLYDNTVNLVIKLDNNDFDCSGQFALWSSIEGTPATFNPVIQLNGDRLRGQIALDSTVTAYNADGSLDGEIFHGATGAGLRRLSEMLAAVHITKSIAFPNNTTLDTTVYTVPVYPAGNDRFSLDDIIVRLDTAIVGAGTAVIEVGATAGGQDYILTTAALSSATTPGVVAGQAILSLGAAMLATDGFRALLAAGATIVCRVVSTGTITGGSFSVEVKGRAL